MFQITFSEHSLKELNKLDKAEQLSLIERLGALTQSVLEKPDKHLGVFNRDKKTFYRLRIADIRLYFELIENILKVNYILPKDSWTDFAFRCKLPITEDNLIENKQSFWQYLDSLGS
jgi:mRNA-degrading endonuclease RelE of RelBE toxin-antitoxin system